MSQSPRQSERDDRRQILSAAGLVGALMLLSRLVGLLREIVTRSSLGVTTVEATAFDIAKTFPEAIFLIIAGGAIGSAFIPTFSAYFTRGDERGAWRLFSAVINLITVGITIVAIVAMIFAPQIITFFYAGNISTQPELLALSVLLMRIMLISAIIFGASGVIMGALNARQHFLLPALAPTIYNLGIIAGALAFNQTTVSTAIGLAIGTVIGALGHFLIQIPGLVKQKASYRPLLTVHDPGVIKVLRLMAPRVLGLSFSEINRFVILYLTGSMPLGSLPGFNAAFRLVILPQGILGQALGIAAFPTLSALAAEKAYQRMRAIVSDSLRLLLFLGLPVTVLLMVLSEPLIVVLFQRGLFGSESTALVSGALTLLATALVALLFLEVIARTFYALSDTLTPVIAGGVQVLVMGFLSVWLINSVFAPRDWFPMGALALSFSISNYLEVALLLFLLRRKLGPLNGRFILNGLWRMLLAGSLMALVMSLLLNWTGAAPEIIQIVVSAGGGAAIYLISSRILRIVELDQLWGPLARRLGGRRKAK